MILVEDLVKDYLIANHPLDFMKRMVGKQIPFYRALDKISFRVESGEVLGIIGVNGAGKSTLLKVLCGVYLPTRGRVKVNGRANAILELSTGFHPELTGRENIRRRMMLHGYSKKEILNQEEEIIEFAELKDVIDQKVQTYSTGMSARLSFATVTSSIADVLFIDEILAVGDEHFQGKSFRRIKDICATGKTVVIVSHGINYVENLCDRAIWLEKGRIRLMGEAHAVGMAYLGMDSASVDAAYNREFGYIKDVTVSCEEDMLVVKTVVYRKRRIRNLHLQIAVPDNRYGVLSSLHNTCFDGCRIPEGEGEIDVIMTTPLLAGLQKGLIGLVLARGSGALPGSVVEDAWGWDNGRLIYFISNNGNDNASYIKVPLKWKINQ